MNLMFEPLRKYAQFDGRARRSEYWLFLLLLAGSLIGFVALLSLFPGGADAVDGEAEPSAPVAALMVIFGLAYLGVIIPSLAVTVRRLHDTNRTGWWIFIRVIPFVGSLVLFIFTVIEGTRGPNRFGPDPKGRDATVEVFS